MPSPARRSRTHALLAAVLAPALLLSACSGDDEPGADPEETGGSSSAPEAYLDVPDGVELTAQGSELGLGDTATVAYQPRQDRVAALDLTVTRLEQASFKQFVGWKLSKETRSSAPYFVHVVAENVGDTHLGGKPVPLYAVDGENKLIEASSFASTFEPCPSKPFPKTFGAGDKYRACLVYLVPDKGELVAASFRPTEEFDPIVWTGEVTEAEQAGDKDGGKDGGKGKQDGKAGKGGNDR